MIKTFADRQTQQLYATGQAKRFPVELAKRAARKLEYIDLATRLDDLNVPPGNRLHNFLCLAITLFPPSQLFWPTSTKMPWLSDCN